MLLQVVEVMLEAESWKALIEKSKQMRLVVGWRWLFKSLKKENEIEQGKAPSSLFFKERKVERKGWMDGP